MKVGIMVTDMSLSLIYKDFDVVDRPGVGSAIIIKTEAEKDSLISLLGGDYNFLFVLDNYDVVFHSVKKENGGLSYIPVLSIKKLKGYSGFRRARYGFELEFEIPVSAKLIDCINEIRRNARLLGLTITCSLNITKLSPQDITPLLPLPPPTIEVKKILPNGEKFSPMIFFTEEIYELMKKLGYAEIVRFEIPVPLIPEAHIEILSKSATELKSAEEKIAKGDYPQALNILRNIIMNYLTKKSEKEKGRVLKEELKEDIISNIPSDLRSIYEKILEGIECTLLSNLDHIHKFIHEITGKLIAIPSKEEAEYVYLMLVTILRYLSQLVIRWRGKY
jgi:hypothetical protein